jgi:hypothetical protein
MPEMFLAYKDATALLPLLPLLPLLTRKIEAGGRLGT